MSMCHKGSCACDHHQLLYFLRTKSNKKANSLLKNIANFQNLADNFGQTLLHYAARYGNEIMVQHLIFEGCDINACNNLGHTALTISLNDKNSTIVEILLKNNADIYEPNNILQLVLRNIVESVLNSNKNNFEPTMEMVFEKVNADFLSEKRESVLLLLNTHNSVKLAAVIFGSNELTKFILENDYQLHFKELTGGCTALHCALMFAKIEKAKILIERGANINATNNLNRAPLYYYSERCENADKGHELMKILLKFSNSREDLQKLIMNRKKETVKAVLQSGIDINTYFPQDRPLLHLLIMNKNADVLNLLTELDIEYDVNKPISNLRTTLLAIAVKHKCVNKVKFLLEHGAIVNNSTRKVDLALSTVIFTFGNNLEESDIEVEIVQLLLQCGNDTEVIDNTKWHPIIKHRNVKNKLGTKIILAHLAWLEALNKSPLIDSTRRYIESDKTLRAQYHLCIRQLEQMKNTQVYNKISLFELLNEKDYVKMAVYARNPEFVTAFKSKLEKMSLQLYFSNKLQRGIRKVIDRIELEKEAALALEKFIGLCSDTYKAIFYQIISYLKDYDLKNLCLAENIIDDAD